MSLHIQDEDAIFFTAPNDVGSHAGPRPPQGVRILRLLTSFGSKSDVAHQGDCDSSQSWSRAPRAR